MTLYVVATPIGNLQDLSERAREVLSTVPLVLAEDTRVTAKLLAHIKARPRVLAYHQHSTPERISELLENLRTNDAALVTDAGTPGVSDPGGRLIQEAYSIFGDDIRIVPIPGPSAVMAAASICGFPMNEFVFLSYPPHKKGRKTFFDNVAKTEMAVIFFESVHRIDKALNELKNRCPNRQLVVCRELTKKFETVSRGTVVEIEAKLNSSPQKGEYVVVVAPNDV